MKDTLTSIRGYLSGQQRRLAELEIEDVVKSKLSRELLHLESQAEFNYRKTVIRNKILGLGLESHMDEIVDGLNQSVKGRCFEITGDSVTHIQEAIRANCDFMLQFGLDYIDRWVMYNKLFGGNKIK